MASLKNVDFTGLAIIAGVGIVLLAAYSAKKKIEGVTGGIVDIVKKPLEAIKTIAEKVFSTSDKTSRTKIPGIADIGGRALTQREIIDEINRVEPGDYRTNPGQYGASNEDVVKQFVLDHAEESYSNRRMYEDFQVSEKVKAKIAADQAVMDNMPQGMFGNSGA